MKFAVLILLLICLVPVLLMAFDLSETAKKERTRRLALAVSRDGRQARSFKDADLEIYTGWENPHRPLATVEIQSFPRGISSRNGSIGKRKGTATSRSSPVSMPGSGGWSGV